MMDAMGHKASDSWSESLFVYATSFLCNQHVHPLHVPLFRITKQKFLNRHVPWSKVLLLGGVHLSSSLQIWWCVSFSSKVFQGSKITFCMNKPTPIKQLLGIRETARFLRGWFLFDAGECILMLHWGSNASLNAYGFSTGQGKKTLGSVGWGGYQKLPMQVHPRKFGKGILDYDCDLLRPYKDPVVFAFLLGGGCHIMTMTPVWFDPCGCCRWKTTWFWVGLLRDKKTTGLDDVLSGSWMFSDRYDTVDGRHPWTSW